MASIGSRRSTPVISAPSAGDSGCTVKASGVFSRVVAVASINFSWRPFAAAAQLCELCSRTILLNRTRSNLAFGRSFRGFRVLRSAIATIIAAACLAASAAKTQESQDSIASFYRGKTVSIVVGSAAGGGFDTYGRLVGRHLGRFIPGNPTVIVQNIPGAGSNKAASYAALNASRDGTVIGAVQAIAVTQTLLSDQPVPHDPSKLVMIGSANSSVFFCVVRSDAPVKSFAETFDKEVIIGTSSEGATLRDYPVMLVNLLGVKMRLIGGYTGSREIMNAMERNEVQGMCGMDW